MVYIPKGEHDDPHELHQQQELEGSTEIEQTLYSHTDIIPWERNPFQRLDYIYRHFQDNEKIHESDPNLARYENDTTLYPHINNDIEYGLFEDVISVRRNLAVHHSITPFIIRQPIRRPRILEMVYKPMRTSH